MATKLKLLVPILLLSLTAFSQTDTSNNCKIILPCTIATKVAFDLVRGDSALAELKITQDILTLTQAEASQYSSIIDSYVIKESNYQQQINLYKQKEVNYQSIVTGLEKDKKRLKIVNKVLGFSVSVTGLTAILVLLTR